MIDPKTLKGKNEDIGLVWIYDLIIVSPISSNDYWRSPFTSICDSKHLVEYIVCDVNVLDADSKPHVYGKESQKVCSLDYSFNELFHRYTTVFKDQYFRRHPQSVSGLVLIFAPMRVDPDPIRSGCGS